MRELARAAAVIASLAVLGVAGAAVVLHRAGYSMPGPADLAQVRHSVTPSLETKLLQQGFALGQPIFIRIFKESEELEVWLKNGATYALFKTYPICAYSGALGPKLKEGDKQAPEGFYSVNRANMKPDSRYHLAFNISFPNAYDQKLGRTGSYLMVHGNCISTGCYAMTDKQIEEIYLLADAALAQGQSAFAVHIFPFRLTEANLARYAQSEWFGFWNMLQHGYDDFEQHHLPPTGEVLKLMQIGNTTTP